MTPRFVLAILFGLSLTASLNAAEFVTVSDRVIELESNKGQLVRLDRPASSVFVANPDIADIQVRTPRLIYVLAKKPGETVLYAVDSEDRVLLSHKLSVSHNLSRLKTALKKLLPNANIDVESVDGALVLTGAVATAVEAEDARRIAVRMAGEGAKESMVNKLSVTAPNQVHLRVRVAEVARTVLKDFGINWDGLFTAGNIVVGLATGNVATAAGAFLTRTDGVNNIFGSFNSGSTVKVDGLIDALDDEGLISILAEPNLTAVSGEQATFLAGGEFPILVPSDNNVTVEFKQFGVSLAFTPTMIGPNRTSLNVNTEVSQLSNTGAVQLQGFTIPALTTRRAQTTVELGSGQSFAIAGLLQNNITQDVSKFPGLGDVPVLGALFRSDKFQRNETELVIIVTPYIVRPVSNQKIAMPTDGLTPPTDAERILFGHTYRARLQKDRSRPLGPNGQSLRGPVGFVLE